jgi:benzaldehyde dehydrogenase (NAD)
MTDTLIAPSGTEVVSREPATGETVARFPVADAAAVAAAAARAAAAQPGWAALPGAARAGILRRAAEVLMSRREELAALLVRESGSIRGKAEAELAGGAGELMAAAALAEQDLQRPLPTREPDRTALSRRVPVGVVGVITPWNFPVVLALRSVAPALALGNAVVLKPDPNTPAIGGAALAEVLTAAGVPADVLQVVHGDADTGQALVADPHVNMISFTGSTEAGRAVGAAAARLLKRTVLELGGNNPFVVLDDADVQSAASAGAWGGFLHQGQICMAARRHLVHRDVAAAYVDALVTRAGRLRLGDPKLDPMVQIGPLINEAQRDRVLAALRTAVEEGATLATGGAVDGLYLTPAVLTGVRPEMDVFRTETFGPVVTVTVFDDDDEAVALANATSYGLTAAVYTADSERGNALARRLRSGAVHVGDQTVHHDPRWPFGGFGDSGNGGCFGGEANIAAFTQEQCLTVSQPARTYPF